MSSGAAARKTTNSWTKSSNSLPTDATSPVRRPVLTGYGAVSSHGAGAARAWEAAAAGELAGADFDPGEGTSFFAAAVHETYRPHANIPRNLAHFLDRGGQAVGILTLSLHDRKLF